MSIHLWNKGDFKMIICGTNKKNLCDDYNCEVTNTNNGICISLSSDDKEKVEQLQKMSDCCVSECCDSNEKKSDSCC